MECALHFAEKVRYTIDRELIGSRLLVSSKIVLPPASAGKAEGSIFTNQGFVVHAE